MNGAQAYARHVLALLDRSVALYPETSGSLTVGGDQVSPPPPSPGASQLADKADTAGAHYHHTRTRVAQLDDETNRLIAQGSAIGQQGRADAVAVRNTARMQAAAILPSTNSPAGLKALVSAMDQRLAAMQRVNASTKAGYARVASGLRASTAGYHSVAPQSTGPTTPHTGADDTIVDDPERRGGIQTVGFGTPPPLAPPPWQDEPLPPPPDSAPGGGRWDVDYTTPYDSGPGGGPPMGPFSQPEPWQQDLPPRVGGSSGLQTIGVPPPNGWRVDPAVLGKESWRFRLVGEQFTPTADHVQWLQQDGNWYRAQWVDYMFEAEHVRVLNATGKLAGLPAVNLGLNEWHPIGIKDIYGISADHPRMNLYLPDICAQDFVIPAATPDHPIMRAPR